MSSVSKTFQELITFSRSTSATYVNSAGYITNTPVVNYLPYSNQFENASWTKSNSFVQQNLFLYSQEFDNVNWGTLNVATPTANTTIAPNGTLTADTVTASAGTASRNISQSSGGLTLVPMTVSVYAKANTLGFLQIFHGSASSAYANFNLTTGVIGTVGAVTAAMASAGNGWYRCSISFTPTAPSNIRLALISSATAVYNESWAAAGTESIFLWGAQVVRGSVLGDYCATTTVALPVLYPDYTGALRARKFCEAATTGTHYISQSTTSPNGTYTLSVICKPGERGHVYLDMSDNATGDASVQINILAGTYSSNAVTGSWSNPSASVISLGNGWYRCSLTGTRNAGTQTVGFVYVSSSGGPNYTGDGSSGIYIADAQLEPGTSVGPYYDTSATLTYAPRLDYDPVTLAAKGLLIEESRQNLLTYSEQFDNAAWNKNTITVTSNAAIAPDGTLTADKLISNAGVFGTVSQAPTVVVSSTYTYSIYAKAAEFSWLRAQVNLITGTRVAWFNLASGSVGTVQAGLTASIVSAGNGFYRCIVAATADNTNGSFVPGATSADNSNTNGDGVSGIYIWGAQVEQGAFASSYIPTVGSQLTRAADVANVNTLSPWFNAATGTMFAIGARMNALAIAGAIFEIGDGTNNNRFIVYAQSPVPNGAYLVGNGGITQASIDVANVFPANTVGKIAASYAVNDFQQASNGTLGTADTSGTLPTVTTAYIGKVGSSTAGQWNGWIQRITYYPQRLTNAQLQSITA